MASKSLRKFVQNVQKWSKQEKPLGLKVTLRAESDLQLGHPKKHKVQVDQLIAENQLLLRQLTLTERNGQLKIASVVTSLLGLLGLTPTIHKCGTIQSSSVYEAPNHQPPNDELVQLLSFVEELLSTRPDCSGELNQIRTHLQQTLRPSMDERGEMQPELDRRHQESQTMRLNNDEIDQSRTMMMDDLKEVDLVSRRSAVSVTASRKSRNRRRNKRSVDSKSKASAGATTDDDVTFSDCSTRAVIFPTSTPKVNSKALHMQPSDIDETTMESDIGESKKVETKNPAKDSGFGTSLSATFLSEFTSESEARQWGSRLVGELAYQLDRRVLTSVFQSDRSSSKRRYYGFLVSNIPEKIQEETLNCSTGKVNARRKHELERRYIDVIHKLASVRYDLDAHSRIAARLVNRHGLLPTPDEKSFVRQIFPDKKKDLEEFLLQFVPTRDERDVTVLLDALVLLAQQDGRPLFQW